MNMDINKILSLLPHRYPFLLVDRVLECEKGEYLVAQKNVTFNEPFFQGHFPVKPVMPGVLMIEALAQATGLLTAETYPDVVNEKTLYLFVGIDKARFKRPVEPGDQLILRVELSGTKRGIHRFKTVATVDDKVAVIADMMCTSREL